MDPLSLSRSPARVDLVFWALLAALGALLLAPLWLGAMPPLTDFGGHVQLAHGYARIGEGPSIWSEVLERRDAWWLPNIFLVRLAAFVHPAIDALTAMRILTTLALVLTVLGWVRVLEAFGRTRWLVFLALPVLGWNGMVAIGFVNYVAGLACIPWALVLARRLALADQPARRDLVALGLVAVVGFLAHGFGALVLIASASLVLVLSVASWRRLAVGLALAPAAALWLHWYLRTRPGPDTMRVSVPFEEKLEAIPRVALDVFDGPSDGYLLAALTVALLLVMVSAILSSPRADRSFVGLRRDHSLHVLALALLGAYFVLPTYIGDVIVSERLIPVFLAVLFAVPRADPARALTRVAVGIGVGVSLAFGAMVSEATLRFDATELAPIQRLAAQIPSGVRAQCVNVQYARPIFHLAPLDHGCNGLLAVTRDVFAGGGFADTPHNAVYLRPDRLERRLTDSGWDRPEDLVAVDYLLAREPHEPPRDELAEVVATLFVEPPPQPVPEKSWTLYRSRLGAQPVPAHTAVAGGDGGALFALECPPGYVVSGLTLGLVDEAKRVQNTSLECSPLADGPALVLRGHRVKLQASGLQGVNRRTLTCSNKRPAAGVAVRSDTVVSALALACGPRPASLLTLPFGIWPLDLTAFRGGPSGGVTVLRCPAGQLLTGLRGRRGFVLDASGIACRTVADLRRP